MFLRVIFLGQIVLLYSLISDQHVSRSGLHQNICYSKTRVFVTVCFLYLLDKIFRQDFLCFLENTTGMQEFNFLQF